MAFGIIKSAAGAAKGAVNKAKDVGGAVVDKARDAGGAVVDKAKDAGGAVVDKAKGAGRDAVSFSREALEWKSRQERNFANGVLEWGKGTVDTVVNIAKDPVGTGKAVGKLASNPVLNPIGGTALALAQGKNPVEAYKDGVGDIKDIGVGLYDGYKEVYQEHGVAGLAGNLAPDVATAVLSGGGSTAAKAGGTAIAKGVARETAEQAVKKSAGEVAEESLKRRVAKDVAGELVPGAEDVVSEAKEEDKPNFLQALIDNFRI